MDQRITGISEKDMKTGLKRTHRLSTSAFYVYRALYDDGVIETSGVELMTINSESDRLAGQLTSAVMNSVEAMPAGGRRRPIVASR